MFRLAPHFTSKTLEEIFRHKVFPRLADGGQVWVALWLGKFESMICCPGLLSYYG